MQIAENLAVNTTGAVAGRAKPVEFQGFVNRAGTAERPLDLGLDAVAEQGFSRRWQARIQQELPSFQTIPWEHIGLVQDEYRKTLPSR